MAACARHPELQAAQFDGGGFVILGKAEPGTEEKQGKYFEMHSPPQPHSGERV
jgi:hypothetical protein